MNYFQAVLLGIVQGLTEFLPVSSSGHLVLFQDWLALRPDSPEMLAFDMVSHVGTLLSLLVVFHKPAWKLCTNPRHAPRILGLALVATVVTAAIALPCKRWFESRFILTPMLGIELILSGVILFATSRAPRPRRGWRQFSYFSAGWVGLAQAVSILPGISRSGATICAAMLLGLRRRWAVEFSFLIAAPAILGASVVKLRDLGEASQANLDGLVGPLIVGGFFAFIVGWFALLLLQRMVQRFTLHWFSFYLWVVGALIVMLA